MHQHPRKSESNSDVVRRDERGARVGGFSIWTQDESGIYDVQFVYTMLTLIAEGNAWRILMAAHNRELEPINLRLLKSELAAACADVSHALRGLYDLADILIVLDEVLCLEVSNLTRQLKFNPEKRHNHPVISHLTASLWFRSMDLTITRSTSKVRGPSNERKNVAAAEKQLESMGYRLTQERGRWPFLTPRL